jgi:hypothetical protein
MIRKQKTLIVAITTLLGACSSLPTYQSQRINTPIEIDGSDKDWTNVSATGALNKLQYTIANDDQYLYISLKTGDRPTIASIMMGGMKLWIDQTGKKAEANGIYYPIANEGEAKSEKHQPLNTDPAERRKSMLAQMDPPELIGFDNVALLSPQNKKAKGIDAKIDFLAQSVLVYEAKVPLDALPNLNMAAFDIGIETGRIKATWTAPPQGSGSLSNYASSGYGMRGGMNGMRGAGMRGGMGGGGMRSYSGGYGNDGLAPIKVWFKIQPK